MSLFQVPLKGDINRKVTLDIFIPLRPNGFHYSRSRPLYLLNDPNLPTYLPTYLPIIGEIWHVDNHYDVLHNMMLIIRTNTLLSFI